MARLVTAGGLLALGLLAALFDPARGSAGACSPGDPPVARLMAIPATIASDGGLLVRAVAQLGGVADASFHVGPNGRLVLRSGHFRVAGREVPARLEPLGSGLARVVPTEPLDGPATWVGASGPVSLRFEARAAALTSAPALSQASLRIRRTRANGEDTDVTYRLGVVLRRDAPAEARALLIYEGDAQQAVAHTELSAPSGRRIEVASGGSCEMFGWPFGWPAPRSQVRAAYVDDSGRLSPLSRPQRLR